MSQRWPSQRGAALLTVMMIVAAMSVAALAITSAVTDASQRSRALHAQAQLGFYAASAEEVAKARLVDVLGPLENRLNADLPGLNEPQIIPVEGGVFAVRARDATNCFNLNRLTVSGDGGVQIADAESQAVYRDLLSALIEDGYTSDIVALVSSLTDWMDDNAVPASGGAEDSFYSSETPAYRTSSQTLASIDELRSIQGYTLDVFARIAPVVCALPAAAANQNRTL
ncbi:MAG: type II secretion system minor pseudopilin GspK, partial [Pseudomonadota bacterium]